MAWSWKGEVVQPLIHLRCSSGTPRIYRRISVLLLSEVSDRLRSRAVWYAIARNACHRDRPVFAIDAAWQVPGVQLSSCTMVGRVGVYKRGRPWRGCSIVMLGVMECISHRGSSRCRSTRLQLQHVAGSGSSYSFGQYTDRPWGARMHHEDCSSVALSAKKYFTRQSESGQI